MKKNYFLTILLTLLVSSVTIGQDLVISGVFDGSLSGGLPKGIELYVLNDIPDLSIYGVGSANNGQGTDGKEYTFPADAVTAGSFIYVASEVSQFTAFFGIAPDYDAGSALGINGDDAVELFMNDAVIDTFGDINTDGSGEAWDYQDGWAYRIAGTGPEGMTFTVSNWTFSGVNGLEGGTDNATANTPFPLGTYTGTASTTPSISFSSPTNNQVFSSGTTTIPVNFNIQNFTLSGDNGSDMSDGTGDGYIIGTAVENGGAPESINIFNSFLDYEELEPGDQVTLTAELVDNSGNSLSPAVTATVSFSVELPCDIQLGTITKVCDAETSGVDTYTTTIPFTVGNTATYTITAKDGDNNDVGTIGGDDPSSVASGNIVISGVSEGTDFTVKVVGDATSSCDLTRDISSPTCIPFPIEETFDYSDGANLGDQASWTRLNSGDDMLISTGSLDYTGLKASAGNKLTFSEGGSETYTQFPDITTGTVYASFLLRVTSFQTNGSPDLDDGGYFAALAGSTSGYDARLWVRPNPDTNGSTFDIGFGFESSNPTFTSSTYNLNDVLFVVLAYNMDSKEISSWINPDSSSFGTTAPTATISTTDTNPPSAINLFILRQDSDRETPFIELDELRISNSWTDVTPSDASASTRENSIEGFKTYPNPVSNGQLTISSKSLDTKDVRIFNVLGKNVMNAKFDGKSTLLNVSSLSKGIYIIKVVEGNSIATQKLIIR